MYLKCKQGPLRPLKHTADHVYSSGCAGVWQGPNTKCVAPSTGIRGVRQVLMYLKDQRNKIIQRIFKNFSQLLNTLGINLRVYVYVVACCFDRQNPCQIHIHVLLNLFEDSMESILNLIIKFKITLLLFLIIIWLF